MTIRWPAGFSPDCSDVWARSELVINAAPAVVFSHLIAVDRWEQNFSGIRNVRFQTPGQSLLELDSVFEFVIDGLHLNVQVTEFVTSSRLAWSGQGIDISVYHAWVVAGSRVLTGFAARGAAAIALREQNAVQRVLDTWIADLNTAVTK